MARVRISKVLPGMILSADVYNDADQLILPEGLKLSDKSIAKLTYYGVTVVNVEDESGLLEDDFEDENESPVMSNMEETSYAQRVQQSQEFKEFQQKFDTAVNEVQGYLSDIVEKNIPPDTSSILESVSNMLHPASGDVNVFDMIHHMRSFDDMTYVHCLNVGLICNVFAKWMGLSKEEQDLVTECGILHDLGKLKISADIIKKPGKLTDDERYLISVDGFDHFSQNSIVPLLGFLLGSATLILVGNRLASPTTKASPVSSTGKSSPKLPKLSGKSRLTTA